MIVKLKLHPLHLIIAFFIPSIFYGMSEPKIAKQHSIKDYGELYSQQGLRSLQAICLGVIADNIKDTIDTKDPLNDKPLIEEILKQVSDYVPHLLEYWKAHTQPTWKFLTRVPNNIDVKWYNSKLAIWFDSKFDKIGILHRDIVSYKDNPFTGDFDCITGSKDNTCIAISKKNKIRIFSGNHPYETIHRFELPDTDAVTSLVFSPDKNALVVGSSDGSIYYIFLNKLSSYPMLTEKHPTSSSIKHLTYAPNGTYFISIDGKGNALKWYFSLHCPLSSHPVFLDGPVFYSIISLDSKFIFFDSSLAHKKNIQPQGFIFDVNDEKIILFENVDIRGVTQGNNFFGIQYEHREKTVARDMGSYLAAAIEVELIPWLVAIDVKGNFQKFSYNKKVTTLISPTNLLDSMMCCVYQNQKSYDTFFCCSAKPTLDQLLFKLALEAALKHNKTAHTKSLLSHSIFSTFEPHTEQHTLRERIDLTLSKVHPPLVALHFVYTHIDQLLQTNKPFDTVLNPDMLDGYDNNILEMIHYLTQETVRSWFSKKINQQTKLIHTLNNFELEGTQYLLSVNRQFVFDTFNTIVNAAKNNFNALKTIQKSGIERKLRTFTTNTKSILSTADHLDTLIKLKNESLLQEGRYYGGEISDYYNLDIAKHMKNCIYKLERSVPPSYRSMDEILPNTLFGQAVKASEDSIQSYASSVTSPDKMKIFPRLLYKHAHLQCTK